MALYGVILMFAALAFFILVRALIATPGQNETLAAAIGSDTKGKVSPLLYAIAIPIAFVAPLVAFGIYVAVALIWFVPDQRIERALGR